MNRRQAIQAGITATAALLALPLVKSKEEPEYKIIAESKRTWPEVATWSSIENPKEWPASNMGVWDGDKNTIGSNKRCQQ